MSFVRNWRRSALLAVGTSLGISTWAGAQATSQRSPAPATQQRPTPPALLPATAFAALMYRSIGPYRGGRSLSAVGSAKRPREYYFGATGGGLWKTTDGGKAWRPVTDGQLRSASVGAVAVAPSGPDTIYIGMGEADLRLDVQQGDGLYRSVDSGKTWTHQGLAETHTIARVRVHPMNGAIAYAAALGRPYQKHAERGVYRTLDAGRTWERVLYRGDSVGAIDLSIDERAPHVLYAAMWQAYRRPWKAYSGGAGSGLFKSIDGGDSWTEITRNPGLPSGPLGRMGIAVSPADSNRVYALIEALGLFVSDDGGATWRRTTNDRKLMTGATDMTRVVADPQLKDRVYVLGASTWRSDDGGRTFAPSFAGTAASNDLWIAPDSGRRMISANEAGGAISDDAGRAFAASRIPTSHAAHVATTSDVPYQVCGAAGVRSLACIASTPRDSLGFDPATGEFGDWGHAVGGAAGGAIAVHPADPNIALAGGPDGTLARHDRRTGATRLVQPWPRLPQNALTERGLAGFPVAFSTVAPHALYAGTQQLWRSDDGGRRWRKVSPDLATVDSSLGEPQDRRPPMLAAALTAIAPSRLEQNVTWIGSDAGTIQLTRDGGRTWSNVTPKDVHALSRVTSIDASAHEPGKAVVSVARDRFGDRSAHVWRTTDYGATWTKISDGFRSDAFVHAVREDPTRKGMLLAGTEHGAYISFDDGARWQPLPLNMPDLQVADLEVHATDLILATRGRGLWVLDDLDVLRQLTPDAIKPNLALFQPHDVPQRLADATFYYHLAKDADSVLVQVLDASGATIQRLATAHPPLRKTGLHRSTWDLKRAGQLVAPGEYQVRVTANGETKTQRFRVLPYPGKPSAPARAR